MIRVVGRGLFGREWPVEIEPFAAGHVVGDDARDRRRAAQRLS